MGRRASITITGTGGLGSIADRTIPETTIVYCDKGSADRLGMTRNELNGRGLGAIAANNVSRTTDFRKDYATLAAGQPIAYAKDATIKDGSTIRRGGTVIPIFDVDGSLIPSVVMGADITPKNEAARQRDEWQAQLVEGLRERERMLVELQLAKTFERGPTTIRIVLSGYSDESQALRRTALANQYVAKPCNSEEIEDSIDLYVRIQELLGNESLRRVVGRIGHLPAMPKIYVRLQTALASPSVTATDISAIVNVDAAIAGKVLPLTNSAFFRRRIPMVRVNDAITYLDFATVRNLVMSAEVSAQWKVPRDLVADVDPEHLQRLAQLTAQACRSPATGIVSSDDAWLAGLVHDLGYWILAQECPEDLKRAILPSQTSALPLFVCERQTIGAPHAEIGAYLLATLAISHSLLGPSGEINRIECGSAVDAPYFASLNAPFDLAEAQRRVAASISPENVH